MGEGGGGERGGAIRELRPIRLDWMLTGAAVVAAVSAYLLAAAAGQAHGPRRTVLLVVGGAATAVTIVLGALQQRRANRRRRTAEQVALEAAEELTLTLGGALAPITNYLGEMADALLAEDRQAIAGQLRQAVVDAAVRLTGPESRSAFYALDPARRELVRSAYGGRSALPRPTFSAGTPDGDNVLDLVARNQFVFIDDVPADPMVTPTVPGSYQTVIAVAVTAGRARLGMLTVDAPRRGDLTRTDVELVTVLANLLGTGLAQAR